MHEQLVQFTVEHGEEAITQLASITKFFRQDILNHVLNEDIYIKYNRYSNDPSEEENAQAGEVSVNASPAVPEAQLFSSRNEKRKTLGNYENKAPLRKAILSECLKQFVPLGADTNQQGSTPWMETHKVTNKNIVLHHHQASTRQQQHRMHQWLWQTSP